MSDVAAAFRILFFSLATVGWVLLALDVTELVDDTWLDVTVWLAFGANALFCLLRVFGFRLELERVG